VFSAVPILDILTMLAAIVGLVLGGIALFGSRKIFAAIGAVLCVLAVVFTALVMSSVCAGIDKVFGAASWLAIVGACSSVGARCSTPGSGRSWPLSASWDARWAWWSSGSG
jgi:hypothetical protein